MSSASSARKFEKQMQKMMIKAQKDIANMNIQAQKDIQKMANDTTLKTQKYNSTEASTARAFNSEEAKISREWQESMSNTAHQREVADLKKAGLNPVLSVGGSGGAASYTTSSASAQAANAQAENPANAIASMMSSLMGSIGQLTTATMQANANRYSADTSAAAQLQAARTSAAATRYAADRQAAAAQYAADTQYQIAMEKPASNPFSLIDKYFGGDRSTQQSWKSKINEVYKDPGKFLIGNKDNFITKNNFKISSTGIKFVDKILSGAKVVANNKMRNLWFKAFIFGDKSAAQDFDNWKNYYQNYYGKH